MLNLVQNPTVLKKKVLDKEYAYVKFNGFLQAKHVNIVISKFAKAICKSPEKKLVVWDCLQMSDYSLDARNQLQDFLENTKDEIETLWVITDSLTVHAAVEIISFFTAFKIRVVQSKDQFKSELLAS